MDPTTANATQRLEGGSNDDCRLAETNLGDRPELSLSTLMRRLRRRPKFVRTITPPSSERDPTILAPENPGSLRAPGFLTPTNESSGGRSDPDVPTGATDETIGTSREAPSQGLMGQDDESSTSRTEINSAPPLTAGSSQPQALLSSTGISLDPSGYVLPHQPADASLPQCSHETCITVCWDSVYVQRECICSPNPWTWAQQNLIRIIDREIAEHICHPAPGRDNTFELEYCIELLFAGRQRHQLRPSIVISTRGRKTKRRVSQYISRSDLKKALRENMLDLYVLVTQVGLAGDISGETDASGPLVVRLSNSDLACGSDIALISPLSGLIASCTLGGFVHIDNRMYGLTALHPFQSGRLSPDDTELVDNDSDDDNDDWDNLDKDEPFCLLHDSVSSTHDCAEIAMIDLQTPTRDASNSDTADRRRPHRSDTSSQTIPETTGFANQAPYQATPLSPVGPAQYPIQVSTSTSDLTSTSLTLKGVDSDWAAFSIPDTSVGEGYTFQNQIDGYNITDIALDDPEQSLPVSVGYSAISARGFLRPGRTLYRQGSICSSLLCMTVERPLKYGCSGAWVVSGSTLIGSVVAARANEPWAYITPFAAIQADVRRLTGSFMTLPTPKSSERRLSWDSPTIPTDLSDRLPSLTRGNSIVSDWSAETDRASSVMGEGFFLDEQEGVLTVPDRYRHDADLPCPFQILDCERVFSDIISFKTHVFTHFRGHTLPTIASCFLCDRKFTQNAHDDDAWSWNQMLSHLANEHYRRGQELATVRTDFTLMRWMYTRRLINDHQFKRLQLVSTPSALLRRRGEQGEIINDPLPPLPPPPPTLPVGGLAQLRLSAIGFRSEAWTTRTTNTGSQGEQHYGEGSGIAIRSSTSPSYVT